MTAHSLGAEAGRHFPRAGTRRAAAWLLAVVVAACTSATPDHVTGPEIASVSITPSSATLSIGTQAPLQASVQDAEGKAISGADVFWSVQDASVATVSGTGVVTGVALGSTEVAASSNGKSGIATITVQKTPVASVVVTPPHVDASPGGKAQFSAATFDAGQNQLSERVITWSTSNAAVATVDGNGMMTAVGQGTASITATAEGKSGVATVTVSQAAVASVAVTPTPLSMSVGQATQLAATLTDSSGRVLTGRVVTWASSNTSVATVSAQGSVTAVAAGSATITATSEGKSGTAAVTVSNVAVGSVVVQPQAPTITQGANVQLSATVRDVNGVIVTDRVVTWSSASPAVATVSSSGVVTGVGGGTATITATSEGRSGTTLVTVQQLPVATVTVQPANDTVLIGGTAQLTAVAKDSAGRTLTGRAIAWHSNSTAIATVDANGLVSGVTAGSTTVTATSEGKVGTATILVVVPIANVSVAPATKSIVAGDQTTFTATPRDATNKVVTGRTLTWSSSNPSVATVTQAGVATGTGVGVAIITATANPEGVSGGGTLTVTAASVTVAPSPDSTWVGSTETLTATARDKNGNPVPAQGFAWSSTGPTIASVNQSGVVTGVLAGSATIVATLTGQSGSVNFKVKARVATVTVSPSSPPAMSVNTNIILQAALKDALGTAITDPGRVITWMTTDTTGIVTITPATPAYSATITAKKPGTVTITASSEGQNGTATITVKP